MARPPRSSAKTPEFLGGNSSARRLKLAFYRHRGGAAGTRGGRHNKTLELIGTQEAKMQRNQLIRFNLQAAIGALAAAVVVSGGLLIASASVVSAPEPARLTGSLYANGGSASATYVN